MTLREFLNLAHAVLVDELMRPKVMSGVTVPGLSLLDALEATQMYAEGYVQPTVEEMEAAMADGDRPVASRARFSQSEKRELSEEEMVAKNNAALAWLERQMSGVQGGLRSFAKA
jgi:hypothetical protein